MTDKRKIDEFDNQAIKRLRGLYTIKFLLNDAQAGYIIGRNGQKYLF